MMELLLLYYQLVRVQVAGVEENKRKEYRFRQRGFRE